MKKMILAAVIMGAMSSSAIADTNAGSGEIKFSGAIITAPCSIAPNDESQEISLGQISNLTLKNGGMSSAQPFSINLEGCELNVKYTDENGDDQTYGNTVNIRFTGTEWVNGTSNTGLLQISGEGQGAGVKIMTDSGSKVELNGNTKRNLVAGNNTLRFQAALQGIEGADVTPGKFDATTNFVLSYN